MNRFSKSAVRFITALIFAFTLLGGIAQPACAQKAGTVTVIKDPKIDSLFAKRLEMNRSAAKGSFIAAEGFRVQIYSGSERNAVYAEQARFRNMYPAVASYISYNQPNYKIRVGDFRTRLEAEKFMNTLRPVYPSLFIFSDKINLPR